MVLLPSDEWETRHWVELYDAMVGVAHRAKQSKAKEWFKHINVDDCYDSVRKFRVKAERVDDDFVILYELGVPWYNHSYRVLSESLVIALRTGKNYRKVLSALDILATAHKCEAVVVGDALTQNGRLASVYERAGFRRESSQFIKEV